MLVSGFSQGRGDSARKICLFSARPCGNLFLLFRSTAGVCPSSPATARRSTFIANSRRRKRSCIIFREYVPKNLRFTRENFVSGHLFELAAGLCSMLVGEDEILGQVRTCYEYARSLGATNGLDAPFQAALACGKKVRTQTHVSSMACSVATLAGKQSFFLQKRQKECIACGRFRQDREQRIKKSPLVG